MLRVNSHWKATLVFGVGLAISVYFLWANQFSHITDGHDQRYAYLATQIFVISGLQFFLFVFWLVNFAHKSHYSFYYFLIFFAALSITILYLCDRAFGDQVLLELIINGYLQ